MPTILEGGPVMASLCLPSPETDPNKRRKVNDSSSDVKCCLARFLTIRCIDTVKTMKDLSLFYIQKALDQIAAPVKNVFRLQDGSLLVETRSDDQNRKLHKQKLLGSYPVLVEKHKTLNSTRGVIFCSRVDGCSADQYVSKSVPCI
jgi:hypothetical protein